MHNTKTISGRVGNDLAERFAKVCKEKGFTRSQGVEAAVDGMVKGNLKAKVEGGKVRIGTVPNEIDELFSALGVGAVTGGIVYFGTKYGFEQNGYDKEEAEDYATQAAIGFAALSMVIKLISGAQKR